MSAKQVDLDHLFDQAAVKLTGASQGGVKAELFDVLHELFSTTDAWQESIAVTVEADATDASIFPGEGGKIIRLDYVTRTVAPYCPVPAVLVGFDTVRLRNPFSAQTDLTAQVIKTVVFPTERHDVPDMPEWLLQVYPLVVLDGVIGKMAGQQAKSYTNMALSKYHLQRFRDGMATISAQTRARHTTGAQAWRFPRAFHAASQRG